MVIAWWDWEKCRIPGWNYSQVYAENKSDSLPFEPTCLTATL